MFAHGPRTWKTEHCISNASSLTTAFQLFLLHSWNTQAQWRSAAGLEQALPSGSLTAVSLCFRFGVQRAGCDRFGEILGEPFRGNSWWLCRELTGRGPTCCCAVEQTFGLRPRAFDYRNRVTLKLSSRGRGLEATFSCAEQVKLPLGRGPYFASAAISCVFA